jgi:hypothetical protein
LYERLSSRHNLLGGSVDTRDEIVVEMRGNPMHSARSRDIGTPSTSGGVVELPETKTRGGEGGGGANVSSGGGIAAVVAAGVAERDGMAGNVHMDTRDEIAIEMRGNPMHPARSRVIGASSTSGGESKGPLVERASSFDNDMAGGGVELAHSNPLFKQTGGAGGATEVAAARRMNGAREYTLNPSCAGSDEMTVLANRAERVRRSTASSRRLQGGGLTSSTPSTPSTPPPEREVRTLKSSDSVYF